MVGAFLSLACLSLLSWVYLTFSRGMYWKTDQRLAPAADAVSGPGPAVRIVVPARNEAEALPQTLPSLLRQDYPGAFEVVVVDDRSEDGTAQIAASLAEKAGAADRLTVVAGEEVQPGWTGKLWALEQGIQAVTRTEPDLLLFTDADIAHPPDSLRRLVSKLSSEDLDLVSVMAQLRVETFWERLLIPAFVYFFGMLYPFRRVNRPEAGTAAAAGGCLLLRRKALERAGGLEQIAGRIIDDCALGRIIKERGREAGGRIWLGLSRDVRSLRAYNTLGDIWGMVARTAFTQLRYSPLLLVATILGMGLVYAIPPLSAAFGLLAWTAGADGTACAALASIGAVAWTLMTLTYLPMLGWYGVRRACAPLLPVSALLYTLMTVDSAWCTWRGRGGAWKGRTYARGRAPRA